MGLSQGCGLGAQWLQGFESDGDCRDGAEVYKYCGVCNFGQIQCHLICEASNQIQLLTSGGSLPAVLTG